MCDLCGKGFTRAAHLSNHRGTRNCCRVRATQEQPRRGINGSGNLRRTMIRKSCKFVQMLKKNVQACLQSRSKRVEFCPYAAGYEAADVHDLALAVKQQAIQAGLRPSSFAAAPRMWAMCKAMAFFMTVKAVEVLQVPPIPWNAAYAEGLTKRLLAARAAKVQVMNTGLQHCSRRSFVGENLSQAAARASVANLVELVKDCVASIEQVGGQTPACPSEYFQSLASLGQPSMGYVQKLAVAISRSCGVRDLRPLEQGGILELHSCDAGCAEGMNQITGDGMTELKNKALLRLRLELLVEVIRHVWPKGAPRVAWSQGQRTDEEKAEVLAVQLCMWSKSGFGTEVLRSTSLKLGTRISEP